MRYSCTMLHIELRMYNTQKKFTYRKNWGSVVISLLFLAIMCWVTITTASDCQYNLSPCNCSFYEVDNNYGVFCIEVPMVDVPAVFQSKPALDISRLYLRIRSEGDFIPSDLVGQSRLTGSLTIEAAVDQSNLIVDPNAFRSSKNSSLNYVELRGLDTSRLDFNFLTDFITVNTIRFDSEMNLDRSLPTLPFLPALTRLDFMYSSDLNNAFTDSVLKCNGLKYIYFALADKGVKLTDEGMSALMNWLLPSSANTLEGLNFDTPSTSITRTPIQLASFKNISYLNIYGNDANMTISTGSIYSKSGMRVTVGFYVMSVEEGAFLGNYAKSSLEIGYSLKRFESGAFKTVLEQMANGSSGYISVYGNRFDCYTDPCHLAWLCRDNRHLLSYVSLSQCDSTGESFEQISPGYFTNCP